MASLKISPGAGTVGTKVSVKGAGFAKGENYKIRFGGTGVGGFRATDRGTTPPGLRFVVPDLATSGERGELGTETQVTVSSARRRLHDDAVAPFELRASLILDARSAGIGYMVRVAGRGLLPGEPYYVTSVVGDNPDVAIGVMATGPGGSADAEFVVPATLDPKEYQIQAKNMKGHYLALRDPPLLNLLGYSESSLLPGRPEGPTSRPYCPVLVALPFTSQLSVPIVATVYAVIRRAGRAHRITSTAVNLAARGSGEALICFATLAPGSYEVDAFAATMTGSVVSETISFPLTIEKP
ncbi:MAG: hypothetical protein OK474_10870 [Thaumarchaeota archaeon]|nr:hypothetical protein [Nitrososphaerota archaeon]